MKRPSLQWYPADWNRNPKLRRCSWAARGAWISIIGLMHDADEYGVLRWPLADLIQAVGCPAELVDELVTKGVLKGCESGRFDGFVYTPMHARKPGAPVTLIAPCEGPLWFCSRLVRDEYVRSVRGKESRFTAPEATPEAPPKIAPDPTPTPGVGEESGDGSSSSSSITPSVTSLRSVTAASAAPTFEEEPVETTKDEVWRLGKELLVKQGTSPKTAGSFVGHLIKQHGEEPVLHAMREAIGKQPADLRQWLSGVLRPNKQKASARNQTAEAIFGEPAREPIDITAEVRRVA